MNDAGAQAERPFLLAGFIEDPEIVATYFIEHQRVIQPVAVTIQQPLEKIHGIFARVHDMPVADVQAEFRCDFEQLRIVHPLRQPLLRLRREID